MQTTTPTVKTEKTAHPVITCHLLSPIAKSKESYRSVLYHHGCFVSHHSNPHRQTHTLPVYYTQNTHIQTKHRRCCCCCCWFLRIIVGNRERNKKNNFFKHLRIWRKSPNAIVVGAIKQFQRSWEIGFFFHFKQKSQRSAI